MLEGAGPNPFHGGLGLIFSGGRKTRPGRAGSGSGREPLYRNDSQCPESWESTHGTMNYEASFDTLSAFRSTSSMSTRSTSTVKGSPMNALP